MNDPVQKSTLSNGLRVVTVELPHLHVGMIAAYVRAGSRHEDPARNGVSHFLEHLFFRGSEGYPDGRTMNALVEDCGGSLNGVTTRDHGYYFSPVHPERLETPIAVLGDAGARRPDRVLELAEKHFSSLRPGAPLNDGALNGAPRGPQLVAVDHVESQLELQVSFRGPPEEHADFPALRVIKRVLDDGLASRMQMEMVERKALAYSVGAGMDGFTDCSVFEVGCACAPRKAPAALAEMLRILAELRETEVPEDELLRAKKKSRIWLEFSLDSPAEMIGWFGAGGLLHPPAEHFDQWLSRIDRVTAADVRRVASAVFRRENLVACAVGPLTGVEQKLRAAVESAL